MSQKCKKALICDIDSVCANFTLSFSTFLNKEIDNKFPIIPSPRFVKHWDWTKWYPITKKEIKLAWLELTKKLNFWETLNIIDIEGIKNLYSLHNELDIYFCTNRVDTYGKSAMRQSQNWLNSAGFKNPNVIVTNNKHEFAKFLGNVEYFIDDKPEYYSNNLLFINKYKIIGIIDYPYNANINNSLVHHFTKLDNFINAVKAIY